VGALEGPGRGATRANDATGPRALLVMGEALGNLVATTLRHGRFVTRTTTDPAECRRIIADWKPQLALVDLDRYEQFLGIVGHGPANGGLACLVFTRKRDTTVKLRAFEAGADDIIEVPFTLDEIVARPFALMRRAHGITIPLVPKIHLDGLEVDLTTQRARVGDEELSLTPIQQALLYLLAANAGRVLGREEILQSLWGGEFETESNVVDRHIRELRVKLRDDWRTPRFIETVAGRGYRFRSQSDREAAERVAG